MSDQLPNNKIVTHLLKTIQYRMSKVIENAPDDFGSASQGYGTRIPIEILSHVSDVLGFSVAQFDSDWVGPEADDWMSEVHRYRTTLSTLNQLFAKEVVESDMTLRLMQGPLADVLTHIGQLSMLRRIAGAPVEGENFFIADLPDVVAEGSN